MTRGGIRKLLLWGTVNNIKKIKALVYKIKIIFLNSNINFLEKIGALRGNCPMELPLGSTIERAGTR